MRLVQVAFIQEVRFGGEYLRVVRPADGWTVNRIADPGATFIEIRRGERMVSVHESNCVFEYIDEPQGLEPAPIAPPEPKKRKKEPTP